MNKTVLILGASGRFGHNAAKAFEAAGWDVHKFDRARDDLSVAMQGKAIVVNAWNPSGYAKWPSELVPMHRRVIAAAKGTDATLVLPGNVYNFSPSPNAPWTERTAHSAQTPLGKLRCEVEALYRASDQRCIILRGGDFIDTQPSPNNWFDQIIIKPLKKGRLSYLGTTDIDHAWAYLPDMTRALVALAAQRDTLKQFEDVCFPGFTLSGDQIAQYLSDIRGHTVVAKKMSWLPLFVARPFMPDLKHVFEMRYLWDTPQSLGAEYFNTLVPDFKPTPVKEALKIATRHI